jgi:Domain of unknown function (DUF4280)/IcmF-related N-terminal domain
MAIFVIILGILGYLFVVIRAAQCQSSPQDGDRASLMSADAVQPVDVVAEGAPSPSPLQVRRVFAESIQWLRTHVSGRNYRYQIPWFMMIGEAGSGKTTVLGNTGMNPLPGQPATFEDRAGQGCGWWFFDKGIVLEIAGDFVLGGHGKRADDQAWHTLLRLLQSHRPQRPIDGIILVIPCTDLIGPPHLGADRLTLPAANITDNKPLVNILPFGMCQSLANPSVASATAAALGVLTSMPCVPVTPAAWVVGAATVLVGGMPALDDSSKLMCMWGGVIEVTSPGQLTLQIP